MYASNITYYKGILKALNYLPNGVEVGLVVNILLVKYDDEKHALSGQQSSK